METLFGRDLFGDTDKRVKVSAKMCRLLFVCNPDYIATICHGRCCNPASGKRLVAITTDETPRIINLGARVDGGFLLPDPATGLCPFKTPEGLCGVHATDQPFGCKMSPFKLNTTGTLIIRHRYCSMRCHRDGTVAAYLVFRRSLEALFGSGETERIVTHLDGGGGNLIAEMPRKNYLAAKEIDAIYLKGKS